MLKIFTQEHFEKCFVTPVKKALKYRKTISYVAPPRKDQNNFSKRKFGQYEGERPIDCWCKL